MCKPRGVGFALGDPNAPAGILRAAEIHPEDAPRQASALPSKLDGAVHRRFAHRRPVARELVPLHRRLASAAGERQVDEADGLARRGAPRPGNAGDRDGHLGRPMGERALGHGSGDLGADRAMLGDERRGHAEQLCLGLRWNR